MSEQPNNQSDNQSDSEETSYLKEAVRLSELMITEQNSTFVTIERKAVLLVTLYIAIITYLWDSHKEVTMILFAIIALIIATLIGVLALYPRPFGVIGANPKYLLWEVFNRNFNKMATDLLDHVYDEAFTLNNKTLHKKSFCLKLSFLLGGACLVLTVILALCYKFGIIMP